MADHFEEVVHLRLSALEARVDAEAMAVREHFLEQQQFIAHSLNTWATTLRGEWRADLLAETDRLEQQLRSEFHAGFDRLEQKLRSEFHAGFDRLEQKLRLEFDARFDGLDQKLDAHHDATRLLLGDILRRLPGQ